MSGNRFFTGGLLLAALIAFLGAGCGKKKLEPDIDFSINVMPVPQWWPREDKDWPEIPAAREAQQQVWAERGTPDYFRIVYTADRRIVRQPELGTGRMAGKKDQVELEWIYFEDGEVISFAGPKVKERDIDDQLRTVCKYGDPSEIKTWPEVGVERSSFTYYDHGKTFYFVDGALTDTYEFKPMAGFGPEF
ncbi:MAG: hypothetical protein RLY93_08565 [Sumerlaeia bacterium]